MIETVGLQQKFVQHSTIEAPWMTETEANAAVRNQIHLLKKKLSNSMLHKKTQNIIPKQPSM